MVNERDFAPNLFKLDSGIARATQVSLGQTTISKINSLELDDDKLVQLIGECSVKLNVTIEKYSLEKNDLLDEQLNKQVTTVIFNSNYMVDKFELEALSLKLDDAIVSVATQKNQLAQYRNELREIITITPDNQTNTQRLIDLRGIIQYLDIKIAKIENDIESAKFQMDSLSKFFTVTFFHLKESISKNNNSKDLYLDTMHKLSNLKVVEYQKLSGYVVAGCASIAVSAYNLFASFFSWTTDIISHNGVMASSSMTLRTVSNIFLGFGVVFSLAGIFLLCYFTVFKSHDQNENDDCSKPIIVFLLSGISLLCFLFRYMMNVDGLDSVVVGHNIYTLYNLGVGGSILFVILSVISFIVAYGSKIKIKRLSDKQDEIYRLCKGK